MPGPADPLRGAGAVSARESKARRGGALSERAHGCGIAADSRVCFTRDRRALRGVPISHHQGGKKSEDAPHMSQKPSKFSLFPHARFLPKDFAALHTY
jgi:hypothetical protein